MPRMMLSPKRLKVLLREHLFELRFCDKQDIDFVRPSPVSSCYEHLHVMGQGKKGEAVYATVAVSAVRHLYPHPCVSIEDMTLMFAMQADTDRHWTIVRDLREVRIWESKLAQVAPDFSRRNAAFNGPVLISRLSTVFNAVKKYVSLIGDTKKIFDREYAYIKDSPLTARSEAEQLAFDSSLRGGAYDELFLACLTLIKFGSTVEKKELPWKGVKCWDDHVSLLPRIYLLTDYFKSKRLEYSGGDVSLTEDIA